MIGQKTFKALGEETGLPPPKDKKKTFKKESEDEKKPKRIGKSFFLYENRMYEQVWDGNKSSYCYFDTLTNEIGYCDSVVMPDKTSYDPIDDEEVKKGYVQLPSRPEDYFTDDALDEEIKGFIHKWLDIPVDDIEIGILTTKKSWVYQRFNTLNYLRVLGDFGAGKSRYLDVFSAIHYKSLKTTGTVTPAALFRIMNKWEGTVAIDEADRKETDETDEVLKIINQGYESENPVWRCDPNDQTKIEFHNVYGPKILSSRKPFTDKATESRCFTTVLRSTLRKDIPPNRNDSFKQESLRIRNKLLMWRFKNYWSIDPEAGSKIDLGVIDPRLRQISVGFVSMFANDDKRLERFRVNLKEKEKDLIEERSQSWEGKIFRAIVEHVTLMGHECGLTAQTIVHNADLRDWKTNELVNPRAITKYMKSLGFGNPKLERDLTGVNRKYYFDVAVLADMAPRYLNDPDLIEKICNSVTVVTSSAEVAQTVTKQPETTEEPKIDHKGESPYRPLQPLHRYKNDGKTSASETLQNIKKWIEEQPEKMVAIDLLLTEFNLLEQYLLKWLERGEFFSPRSGYIAVLR